MNKYKRIIANFTVIFCFITFTSCSEEKMTYRKGDIGMLKEKCINKLAKTSKRIKDTIPYTTKDGVYNDFSTENRIGWWTNSFWTGILWQLYEETGDSTYKKYAESTESKLQKALYALNTPAHDIGFWYLLSGVRNYELTGNEKSRSDSLLAADILMSRFNINMSAIRAWEGEGKEGIVIIDSMMNVPLLYWASKEIGDNRFALIADIHANTVKKHFVREDGSVCHILRFDTTTGEMVEECDGQGYAPGSSWTRGQGWAIYGFAQCYEWTKNADYLETAKKVSDYFISEAEKNDYKIKSDFRQPEDNMLYDSSAAAIAACGMIEIYKHCSDEKYLNAAKKLVFACDEHFCPWDDENDEALLKFASERYVYQTQISLIYGDYYFFKAVCELDKITGGINNEKKN